MPVCLKMLVIFLIFGDERVKVAYFVRFWGCVYGGFCLGDVSLYLEFESE